jgi:hypothetical protein
MSWLIFSQNDDPPTKVSNAEGQASIDYVLREASKDTLFKVRQYVKDVVCVWSYLGDTDNPDHMCVYLKETP